MPFVPALKAAVESLPPSVGGLLARMPFSMRPVVGSVYRRRVAEMREYESLTTAQRLEFVFSRVSRIAWHAWNYVPFYRALYEERGFHPSQLVDFSDLSRIPIVTKEMLRASDRARRSAPGRGRFVVNTGGSSGSPLDFYILPSALGHEWAHMLSIWRQLGYRHTDVKLGFMGRNVGEFTVKYDALRHQYSVNIFSPFRDVARELSDVVQRTKIRYLHGYPSALYEFARSCASQDPRLVEAIRRNLRGAFLASEYPLPRYRDEIERVFGVPTVSWYGHTERAILAAERERPYVYEALQTYGFTEAVPDDEPGVFRLVGTAYYNTASPFVRYDTGDRVRVVSRSDRLLERFEVESGREGDFIVDRTGQRLSLTGLLFGRHHGVFGSATFVQISQWQPGKATLIVTMPGRRPGAAELEQQFDLSGIDVDFRFEAVERPVLTASGKVVLNVSKCERGA